MNDTSRSFALDFVYRNAVTSLQSSILDSSQINGTWFKLCCHPTFLASATDTVSTTLHLSRRFYARIHKALIDVEFNGQRGQKGIFST